MLQRTHASPTDTVNCVTRVQLEYSVSTFGEGYHYYVYTDI